MLSLMPLLYIQRDLVKRITASRGTDPVLELKVGRGDLWVPCPGGWFSVSGIIALIDHDRHGGRTFVCGKLVEDVSIIYRVENPHDEWNCGRAELFAKLWKPRQSFELAIRRFSGRQSIFRFTHNPLR